MEQKFVLVETPWETRNLEMQSYSILSTFYQNPDFSILSRNIQQLYEQHKLFFVYTRIEKSLLKYVSELQRLGFFLIECTLTPFIELDTNTILSEFQKNKRDFIPLHYQYADITVITLDRQKDFPSAALMNIAQESFSEDRFHCDVQCSKEIADRRFAYWITDLMTDNDVIFDALMLDHEVIGFTAYKQNYLILSGIAKKYIKSGFGKFLWLSLFQGLKENGHHIVETLISANNLPVLNLSARLGFKFKETQYSFHYWGIT